MTDLCELHWAADVPSAFHGFAHRKFAMPAAGGLYKEIFIENLQLHSWEARTQTPDLGSLSTQGCTASADRTGLTD